MNNIKELEIDGIKPSELNALLKPNYTGLILFSLTMAITVGFVVRVVYLAITYGEGL